MVSTKPSFPGDHDPPTEPRYRSAVHKAEPWPTDDYCDKCAGLRYSVTVQKELRWREAEEHQRKQDERETEVAKERLELKEEFLERERQLKKDHKTSERKLKEEIEYLKGEVSKVNDFPSSTNHTSPTLFTFKYI